MALAMGAFALVSCNKDDKNDEKNGGQEKFLPYEQQQKIIEQSVEGLAQTIEFKDLAGSVSTILENVVKLANHEILWEWGLENACQDSLFAVKFAAIKELLNSDEIDFNLAPLYMEANITFMPNIPVGIVDPDSTNEGAEFDPDEVALLPIIEVVNHNSDCFKANFIVEDHVLVVTLKGSNEKDVRMAWVDTKKGETKNINLPNIIDLSITLDGKNVLSAGGLLDTDFNVAVTGYYDRSAENDTTFKVSEVKAFGQNLTLNANVAIDKYAVEASAIYGASTGLNVEAKAMIEDREALALNVNLDATLDEYINWADYTTILSWAMNPENVRSLKAKAVLGGDQIKVVASIKENPVKYQEILGPAMMFMGGGAPEADAIKTMIDKANEIFVGEIYFKGYDKPQAKLRIVYEEPTEKTKAGSSIFSSLIDNISNSGLRIMVDTYDAEGNEVTISFNEYFGKINLKGALDIVKTNFEEAFSSVIG